MTLRRLRLAAAIASALACGHAAAQQSPETPAFPIWLAPALELKSQAEIDTRLNRAFEPEERIKLTRNAADKTGQEPRNCASLSTLAADGYRPQAGVETYLYYILKTTCDAVGLVRAMRPSKQSYVNNLVLNEAALRVLPARIDLSVACGTDGRLPGAEFSAMSWHDYSSSQNGGVAALGKLDVAVRNNFEITVKSAISETTFEILARGDLDFDGVEDLLVRVSRDLSGSAPGAAAIFMLTRDTPDGVLRLLDDRCGPRFPIVLGPRPR